MCSGNRSTRPGNAVVLTIRDQLCAITTRGATADRGTAARVHAGVLIFDVKQPRLSSSPPDLIRWSMVTCGLRYPIGKFDRSSLQHGLPGHRWNEVTPFFKRLCPAMTLEKTNERKEGKRNADGRVSNRSHHFGCGGVLSGARSPVGVPPRLFPRHYSSPRCGS